MVRKKKRNTANIFGLVLLQEIWYVEFTVNFDNYASLLSFLKYAESEDFLKNFNKLILTDFSSSSNADNTHQLKFDGNFITLHEN